MYDMFQVLFFGATDTSKGMCQGSPYLQAKVGDCLLLLLVELVEGQGWWLSQQVQVQFLHLGVKDLRSPPVPGGAESKAIFFQLELVGGVGLVKVLVLRGVVLLWWVDVKQVLSHCGKVFVVLYHFLGWYDRNVVGLVVVDHPLDSSWYQSSEAHMGGTSDAKKSCLVSNSSSLSKHSRSASVPASGSCIRSMDRANFRNQSGKFSRCGWCSKWGMQ